MPPPTTSRSKRSWREASRGCVVIASAVRRAYSIVSGRDARRHPAANDAVREYWNQQSTTSRSRRHPSGRRVLRRPRPVPLREAASPAAARRLRRAIAGTRGARGRAAAPASTWCGSRKGAPWSTGVDLAASAIALAPAELRAAGARRPSCASPTASSCRFPTRFDLVFAHGVVQYTADDRALVDECRRVLKPGGTAIFQVYNRISWLNALSKLMKVGLEHDDAPVLLKYSIGEFRRLLAGFSRRAHRAGAVSGEVAPARRAGRARSTTRCSSARSTRCRARSCGRFGWHLLGVLHRMTMHALRQGSRVRQRLPLRPRRRPPRAAVSTGLARGDVRPPHRRRRRRPDRLRADRARARRCGSSTPTAADAEVSGNGVRALAARRAAAARPRPRGERVRGDHHRRRRDKRLTLLGRTAPRRRFARRNGAARAAWRADRSTSRGEPLRRGRPAHRQPSVRRPRAS